MLRSLGFPFFASTMGGWTMAKKQASREPGQATGAVEVAGVAAGLDLFYGVLRQAIEDDGRSPSRIATECRLNVSQLTKFLSGKQQTLRAEFCDRLAEHLGIQVRIGVARCATRLSNRGLLARPRAERLACLAESAAAAERIYRDHAELSDLDAVDLLEEAP